MCRAGDANENRGFVAAINIPSLRDSKPGQSPIDVWQSRMAGMDGVLIIDKSAGMTSHDVVALVRKVTGHRRVGHTGTLDPLATGVMVVCLGQATRIVEYLTATRKEYAAGIILGISTAAFNRSLRQTSTLLREKTCAVPSSVSTRSSW